MSAELRVAQVLTASTGGIGRHVAQLTEQLLVRGHRVQVWCPPATAEQHLAELVARGLRVHHRLGPALLTADVVHAHGYKATAQVLVPARLGRRPVVSTWHNLPPQAGVAGRVGRLTQRIAAGADLVLGASADLVDAARALGATARLGPVAAPVRPVATHDRSEVRRRLGTPATTGVVLTVGRLAEQKNLGMLVEVATRLAGRSDVEVWLAGAGPEHDRISGLVADRGLGVRLLGHRDDVADLVAAADVALLTSHWEARALYAQEAMAAGLPLVTTAVGGMADLVGDAAVLVPPGDDVAAARAIERLLDRPHDRRRLAAAGQARAATWPDPAAMVQIVLDAYAEVLITR